MRVSRPLFRHVQIAVPAQLLNCLQAALLVVCGLTALSSQSIAQDRMSDARIVRNFDIIALRNEHIRLRNPRVTKWRRPIRFYIQRDVAIEPVIAKDLRDHMRRLAKLTRLPIAEVDRRGAANFVIVFTRMSLFPQRIREYLRPYNPALARRLGRAACIGIFRRSTATNEIVRGVAIIPVDFARERGILYGCIVEETTQLMGLPNDSSDVYPSIFNDHSRLDDLSWHDQLLLRLLYHPEMRVGMSRADALAVARRILPPIRAQMGR